MKRLFGLILVLAMVAMLGTCSGGGGGGGDGDDDGGGTLTPITGALFPEDVRVIATGDVSGCGLDYDSCAQLSACTLSCVDDYMKGIMALDPKTPDYETKIEALETSYNTCTDGCYLRNSDCDMGSAFVISLVSTNTGAATRTIKLTPGITFVPTDGSYQRMMVIQPITITVTPGKTETTCVPVYCIDSSLSAPGGETNYTTYTTQSAVEPASDCLSGILTSLNGVDFESLTSEHSQGIQDVVWTCMDTGDIEADDQVFLDSLPEIGKRRMFSYPAVKIPNKNAGSWKSQFVH